ncbi:ABC transporter ATP-binding protein [Gemmatimonadota bacterium]
MKEILQVSDLWLAYNAEPVIQGLSFNVQTGSIVALLGRNGAGKSTVLHAIGGILPVRQGAILFEQECILGWSTAQRIRNGLTYVAQGRECFPNLTVGENLWAATLALGIDRRTRKQRVDQSLAPFSHLHDYYDTPVVHLSGGQQQMLVLAMALIQRPKCLLLDEPSIGLSDAVLKELEGFLLQYKSEGGSVLLVEQKPRVVFSTGDYAYYLHGGKVLLGGSPDELRSNLDFVNHYLGRLDV